MAAGLIRVYRQGFPGDCIDIAEVLDERELADFGKLVHWDLVDPWEGARRDGSQGIL